MDRNTQKEEFSCAYIKAVASVAGYTVENKLRPMDNAGVDVTIEVPGEIGEVLFPKFDAQVKCTSQDILHENYIRFPLKVKNYNKLRHERPLTPQILIIVLVPSDISEWLNISEEETLMKKCGYWISLKGWPETNNNRTITIDIPRSNLFTPSALKSIMNTIVQGVDL
jgi:hypothetical protein